MVNRRWYWRNFILCGLSILVYTIILLGLAAADSVVAQNGFLSYVPLVSNPLPESVDDYETDFTNSIAPWKAVRWDNGDDFVVEHNDGCENSQCGFLDATKEKTDSYLIVSPQINGPGPSYTVLVRAKLKDRVDKSQFGIVFGAGGDGGNCPGQGPGGCFDHYYIVRVRYRDANDEKYLEYRIQRVDAHDDNNLPDGEDLVDWTRAESVDPEDFNKWEVSYGSSGHIRVKANNHEQAAYARDNKFLSSRGFGVYVKAGENGAGRALFDRFRINPSE